MEKSLNIEQKLSLPSGMDFNFLRRTGLDYLQKIIGHIWTDYNIHDPGVTILEALCYAITDLSYRLEFSIEDLLAVPIGSVSKQFFSADEILSSNPVTVNDYRKLLIDIPGVKNAWLQPCLDINQTGYFCKSTESDLSVTKDHATHNIVVNGLYEILIDVAEDYTEAKQQKLKETINATFLQHRNLCEDIAKITFLPIERVMVKAEVEITNVGNANQVLAEIYFRLEQFLAPQIHRYSLQQMLDKNYSTAEIFSGPLLKNGFIDEAELTLTEKKTELHVSNLIALIMDVTDVSTVAKVFISCFKDFTIPIKIYDPWIIEMDVEYTPRLALSRSLSVEVLPDDLPASIASNIVIMNQGVPCVINTNEVKARLVQLRQTSQSNGGDIQLQTLPLPKGEYRELKDYVSIQNEFPENYGLGEKRLSDSVSAQRKAQVKQLQAYLMFFDQILANYFSQLDHMKELLAVDSSTTNPETVQSYCSLALTNVAGIENLWKQLPDNKGTFADIKNLQTITEDPNTAVSRKNRFLDHLLARFAEQFPNNIALQLTQPSATDLNNNILQAKATFLAQYATLSATRSRAFNYASNDADLLETNVASLKQRIAKILDIVVPQIDTHYSQPKFYLLEHILLRPQASSSLTFKAFVSNTKEETAIDPLSFQLSVILFMPKLDESAINTQKIITQTLIEEVPAHINIYLHWLEQDKLTAFESAYLQWQSLLYQFTQDTTQAQALNNAAAQLLALLPNFKRLSVE